MIDKLLRWKFILINFKNYPAEINRRVNVENQLWLMASGKVPLPDKEKCKELAIELGVPKSWSKKNG